ncbi:MAG: formylglycine-generating enzyme family protein [Candidatus Omnitrophota bacterium]
MDQENEIKVNVTPAPFPHGWASDWGEDPMGYWMSFTYKNVRQTFRWIPPGTFWMGSPEEEPERADDERLHEVILTHGFWLADTCCTQALWQAIMGENPSYFKGESRPIEKISWKDCQKFIDRINHSKEGLALRLPSEAEWEYACRAGTTTPFSFGRNVTPEQVNYHGAYPYADGKKGNYREETVDVKFLACNNWGLYEMHGNVWEWCSDWYGDYPIEQATNPKGPDSGADRVLRGGSWFYFGQDLRSALRGRVDPDARDADIGFRLSRDQ